MIMIFVADYYQIKPLDKIFSEDIHEPILYDTVYALSKVI